MKDTIIKIVMNNGKSYLVKLKVNEQDSAINDILTKYIFADYEKDAGINFCTFDLVQTLENVFDDFNSVVINLNDISAIEYVGGE